MVVYEFTLDTADEDADSDDGDVEDRGISEKLLFILLKHLSSVQESEIVGIWFAGIYETKKNKNFCNGCLLKRFLKDEEDDIESTEMRCFKPKVGSSTVMEDTPDQLPAFLRFMISFMVHLMFYLCVRRNGVFLIMTVFFIISRYPTSTENI